MFCGQGILDCHSNLIALNFTGIIRNNNKYVNIVGLPFEQNHINNWRKSYTRNRR